MWVFCVWSLPCYVVPSVHSSHIHLVEEESCLFCFNCFLDDVWLSVLCVFIPRGAVRWYVFVCFDSVRPIKQYFSYKGAGLPGLNQYLARINVLAQGHNTVTPVRLESAAPWSWVKHSTTEPPRSLRWYVIVTFPYRTHLRFSRLQSQISLYFQYVYCCHIKFVILIILPGEEF